MKRNIAIAALLFAMAAQATADGKMYWRESIPPKIPYQRALILFKDGTETIVLQSKYEIPKTEEKASLGWVVPVPAVPQVASMPADMARHVFMYLSRNSRPRVTRILPTVFNGLFLGTVGVSLLTLLLCLLSLAVPFPSWFQQNRGRLLRGSLYGLLACLLMGLLIPSVAAARGSFGVDVIAEHRVGIYDVRIVRSNDSGNLISWLNANEFRFAKEDRAAFDSYVSRGWCFVVANINPTTGQDERTVVSEGLAAPLILRFPHDAPIYPVTLTGTGNHETEILIYLASSAKMTCDDRLTLRFAGEMQKYSLAYLPEMVEPEGFFKPDDPSCPYLCKFKDTLTPSQMTQDIVFTTAGDNEHYREHIVKW